MLNALGNKKKGQENVMKWLVIILTAMFTGAKLAHIISWSWWLVLLPVWIYMGFMLLLLLIAFVVVVIEDV